MPYKHGGSVFIGVGHTIEQHKNNFKKLYFKRHQCDTEMRSKTDCLMEGGTIKPLVEDQKTSSDFLCRIWAQPGNLDLVQTEDWVQRNRDKLCF